MRLTTPKGRRSRSPLAMDQTSTVGIWVPQTMAVALSGLPHGGCILEPTYAGGLGPSLITGHGQDFHPGSLRSMAHGELARGMARNGYNTLGNCEIAQTNRSTPIIGYCLVQTRRVKKLDSMVDPCTGQHFRL
jgi:hypothetical protein